MTACYLDNLLERIEAAKDRFILLSLVADAQKLLSADNVQADEYTSIIRAFLNRIDASLFGQLTTREFEHEFGKLFLQKRFAREIFVLLIQSLSDVDSKNSYKFSKIVDLVELIQTDVLTMVLRERENTKLTGCKLEMADSAFSQTLCSYPDRIFNYFGASEMKNLSFCTSTIANYEERLLQAIQSFLSNPSTVEADLSLCAKLIADYSTVSPTFADALVKWIVQNGRMLKISPSSIFLHESIEARKLEQLVISVFLLLTNGFQISIVFGDSIRRHALLRRIFTRKLLVERISPFSSTPTTDGGENCGKVSRSSRKIVEYLREIGGDRAIIRNTFAGLVQVFSDQSRFLNSVGFDHQFQLAAAIIDFARALDKSDIALLRHEVSMELASIVPEYLKLPDNCRRQIGMFVTEFISNLLVEDEKNKLNFEYNYDSTLSELKAISEEKFANIGGENLPIALNLEEQKRKAEPKNMEMRAKKIFADSRTKILDSDDDDDETGAMNGSGDKSFEDEILEHQSVEQNRPNYIRDCLECLSGEKENFKNFAVALRTLPTLIRSKAIGFEDLAGEILDLMICIEDRFRLPDFQELRKESATLVLTHRPELVGHAVRVLFSKQCSMLNRFFILGCMDAAAAFLAGEKTSTKTGDESRIEILDDSLKNGEKTNTKLKQIGKVTRRSCVRPAAVTGQKNSFAEIVPQFVYPLLNVSKIGNHLDLYDRDSILMGKVLSTVGQMIFYARSSPHIPNIISTVFAFLTPLRNNPQTFVLSGCLFCYSAIADAPMSAECFGTELGDALEWASTLLDATQSQQAADTMYRDTLFVTVCKLRRAVFGDKDEEGEE